MLVIIMFGIARFFTGLTQVEADAGSFERPISLFRTTYAIIVETVTPQAPSSWRSLPSLSSPTALDPTFSTLWYLPHAPHGGSFVPLHVHSERLPKQVSSGSRWRYDEDILFWSHLAVANYMERSWGPMLRAVQGRQAELEEVKLSFSLLLFACVHSSLSHWLLVLLHEAVLSNYSHHKKIL